MNSNNAKQDKNLIIRASAGTGKTYRLTNRYIKLLLDGAKPQDILAVTFMRKAAGEIFDRVLKRLADAAGSPEECAELSKAVYGDPAVLTQEAVRKTLAAFVRNMHRARISTIDSFFGQTAGSFAPELGFPIGWKIVEESVLTQNRQRAILEAFSGGKEAETVKLIYDFFKGEAKRSLTEEIDNILDDYTFLFRESEKDVWFTVPEQDQKELSSQDKNALIDELRAGAQETMDSIPPEKRNSNTDKFAKCAETLISAFSNDDYDGVVGNTLFQGVVFSPDDSYKYSTSKIDLSPSFRAAIKAMSESIKLTLFKLLKKETEATYQLIADIDARLEKIKSDSGEYGFDDITFHLSKLGAKYKENLDYRLDNRTKHILLDEFQDTSYFQWKILEPLTDAIIRSDAPDNSFFCVGDTKQSIYHWRGGMPELFDRIETEYKSSAGRDSLVENYRSAPEIMRAVNDVFGTIGSCEPLNPPVPKKKTKETKYASTKKEAVREAALNWNKFFEEHKVPEKNGNRKGLVSLEEAPNFADRTPEEWQDFFGVPVDDAKDLQAAYAARRIRDIHNAKPKASIGVLFRKGKKLEKVASLLKQMGVEVSQEGGNPLATAASVRAVLALLRVADHPGDTAALARTATVPELLGAVPEDIRPDFERFAEGSEYLAAAGESLSSWARGQVMTLGLGGFVRTLANRILPICNTREAEKLGAFVKTAFRFEEEQAAAGRLDRFISLTETKDVSLPGDSSIHLMTIHKSKGFEYDVVVLPELEPILIDDRFAPKVVAHRQGPTDAPDAVFRNRSEGIFSLLVPDFPIAADTYFDRWKADANESLNILYVAMTRARHELLMITETRGVDSNGKPKKFSAQSFQDILRIQLESKGDPEPEPPLNIGENVFYRIGNPDWYTLEFGSGADTKEAAPPRAAVKPFTPCAMPQAGTAGSRAPSHKDFHRVWVPAAVKERGLVIHACFEQIEWLESPLSDEEFEKIRCAVRRELFAGKPLPANFDTYLEGFRRLCGEPQVLESLSAAYYAKNYPGLTPRVFRERPYLTPLRGPGRKKGVIDRLVILFDGENAAAADIIDFKSDIEVHRGIDRDEYVRRMGYDRQLAEYRKYIRTAFDLDDDRVATRLFFYGCDDEGKARTLPPCDVARP